MQVGTEKSQLLMIMYSALDAMDMLCIVELLKKQNAGAPLNTVLLL